MVSYHRKVLGINFELRNSICTIDQLSIFLYFLPPVVTPVFVVPSIDPSPFPTMSKTLMVVGLTMMVMCACFEDAAGQPSSPTIGYGAVGSGGSPRCSAKNPQECNKVPANPYQRGCEKENHCREGGRKLLEEGI